MDGSRGSIESLFGQPDRTREVDPQPTDSADRLGVGMEASGDRLAFREGMEGDAEQRALDELERNLDQVSDEPTSEGEAGTSDGQPESPADEPSRLESTVSDAGNWLANAAENIREFFQNTILPAIEEFKEVFSEGFASLNEHLAPALASVRGALGIEEPEEDDEDDNDAQDGSQEMLANAVVSDEDFELGEEAVPEVRHTKWRQRGNGVRFITGGRPGYLQESPRGLRDGRESSWEEAMEDLEALYAIGTRRFVHVGRQEINDGSGRDFEDLYAAFKRRHPDIEFLVGTTIYSSDYSMERNMPVYQTAYRFSGEGLMYCNCDHGAHRAPTIAVILYAVDHPRRPGEDMEDYVTRVCNGVGMGRDYLTRWGENYYGMDRHVVLMLEDRDFLDRVRSGARAPNS